jgi:hypothetical protein
MTTLWEYRTDVRNLTQDLVGFEVESLDGDIGKIDETSNQVGSEYLVVDTGFWIFGKKRMIPAGVVDRIDPTEGKLFVRMTKDQIKSSPDFEDVHRTDRDPYDKYYDTFWS